MYTSVVGANMTVMVTEAIKYLREVKPIEFPGSDPEWEMGETTKHQLLCEVLRSILRRATGDQMVCSDQFVYFDAADPKRKCAPDAFVKLGTPWGHVTSWKTWEDGVPELCIEVLSPREFEKLTLAEKLKRFHTIGVQEVIAFDPDGNLGARLRAWDRIEGDLVERKIEGERTPCRTLTLLFIVAPAPLHNLEAALRLWDPTTNALIPTAVEAECVAKEHESAAKEDALAEVVRLKNLLATR
jgi:Putative restriction endonuclease